jgi:hypothetical protein
VFIVPLSWLLWLNLESMLSRNISLVCAVSNIFHSRFAPQSLRWLEHFSR